MTITGIITKEEQRAHLDEWITELRSDRWVQIPWVLKRGAGKVCVVGLAYELKDEHFESRPLGVEYWFGINGALWSRLVVLNNGAGDPLQKNTVEEGFGPGHRTFPELADWLEHQREAYDGDLTSWDGDR